MCHLYDLTQVSIKIISLGRDANTDATPAHFRQRDRAVGAVGLVGFTLLTSTQLRAGPRQIAIPFQRVHRQIKRSVEDEGSLFHLKQRGRATSPNPAPPGRLKSTGTPATKATARTAHVNGFSPRASRSCWRCADGPRPQRSRTARNADRFSQSPGRSHALRSGTVRAPA